MKLSPFLLSTSFSKNLVFYLFMWFLYCCDFVLVIFICCNKKTNVVVKMFWISLNTHISALILLWIFQLTSCFVKKRIILSISELKSTEFMKQTIFALLIMKTSLCFNLATVVFVIKHLDRFMCYDHNYHGSTS